MKEFFVNGKDFSEYLIENIKEKNNYFVFATDVVMNSWIDFLIMNPDKSGISAIELERFIAWDKFKDKYIRGTEIGKSAIPSELRRIFVNNIIEQNSNNLFFKKIINPEYAKNAANFTDWMVKLLSSLKLWYTLKTEIKDSYDEEDEDFKILYEKYTDFLNKYNFFEPSWINPDFSESDKNFFIIYPELLEDFSDYEDTLSKSNKISIVKLGDLSSENNKPILCSKYSDSRTELRRTILQIRKLVQDKKAEYPQIALSVPDLETYKPYIEREFTKYCVPFVIKAGNPITKNCAGKIFNEIYECYTSNFSYNSVRTFLLDENIPWKEELIDIKESLIREGNRMHCLFNYETNQNEKIDIWEIALKGTRLTKDERELKFYQDIKTKITKICNSTSFEQIHQNWMLLKNTYLSIEDFSLEANNIISRCIVHLNELIQIEKKYLNDNSLKISNPYFYFINSIKNKSYTPQTKKMGVSIYAYKLSAMAHIKYQFVINASQKNLEISNKKLNFLNGIKRKRLGLLENDKKNNSTKAFISLYAKYADDSNIVFSYAENSFSGYEICHNYLTLLTDNSNNVIENPFKELDSTDFILNEKKLFLKLSGTNTEPANTNFFSESQKEQFNLWFSKNKKRLFQNEDEITLDEKLKTIITDYLTTNRNKNNDKQLENKIIITQSDLKMFKSCPRKWLLSNVLKLSEDSLDVSLINPNDMGTIYHKILENFMRYYLETKTMLPCTNENLEFDNEEEIFELILQCTNAAIHDFQKDFSESPLTIEMLEAQKNTISKNILDFVKSFLKPNNTPKKINARTSTSGFGNYYVHKVEDKIYDANVSQDFAYYGIIDCLLSKSSPQKNESDKSLITSWNLIDYKSGKMPTKNECLLDKDEEISDFQIPTYITLVKSQNPSSFSTAGFISINSTISKNELNKTFLIDEYNEKEQEEAFEPVLLKFVEYSKYFTEQIKKFDFDPESAGINKFTDCTKCNFKSICRYSFNIAGKTMKKNSKEKN